MCDFGLTKPLAAPEGSRSYGDEEHTNPLLSARNVSRAPMRNRGSPDFGGGVGYREDDAHYKGHIPEGDRVSVDYREHIPENSRPSPQRPPNQSRTPPEDQVPKGCSLHSMEPLREWFCKGADMKSLAEYEDALCQLEENPPDIRQYNVNIREERWTNFSLEGVRFPAMTVDAIQRGEALAIFERDLIIHFQQISRAAALYMRALLGHRALEQSWTKRLLHEVQPWALLALVPDFHCVSLLLHQTSGVSLALLGLVIHRHQLGAGIYIVHLFGMCPYRSEYTAVSSCPIWFETSHVCLPPFFGFGRGVVGVVALI